MFVQKSLKEEQASAPHRVRVMLHTPHTHISAEVTTSSSSAPSTAARGLLENLETFSTTAPGPEQVWTRTGTGTRTWAMTRTRTGTRTGLTLLSRTRLRVGAGSWSRVSAAVALRVSGSRRPRQPAESPLRQKTVKGTEEWTARWKTAEDEHTAVL